LIIAQTFLSSPLF